jgi:ABC-type amino acid transport substrate-binding protein
MNAKQYADLYFKDQPTYNKIAREAFEAGKVEATPDDIIKLKYELGRAKQELKDLWSTLKDPEECAALIAGL